MKILIIHSVEIEAERSSARNPTSWSWDLNSGLIQKFVVFLYQHADSPQWNVRDALAQVFMTEEEEKEGEIPAGTFLQRHPFVWSGNWSFPMIIKYQELGMHHFLWLVFEGTFPMGIYNTEDERIAHFPGGETWGRLS